MTDDAAIADIRRELAGARGTEATTRLVSIQTITVDDVNADSRYLACSVETQSEIVVPVMRNAARSARWSGPPSQRWLVASLSDATLRETGRGGDVVAEIDVDSDAPAAFARKGQELLEDAATLLAEKL